MIKVELLDQTHINHNFKKLKCQMDLILNPNTNHSSVRPCRKNATYRIAGVTMCTQHAGLKVLEWGLKHQ